MTFKKLDPKVALDKVRQLYPDFDPFLITAQIAMDRLTRVCPISGLPIDVPVMVSERLQAVKEINSYIMPKVKAIEISVDAESIARSRLLGQVPLSDLTMLLDSGMDGAVLDGVIDETTH